MTSRQIFNEAILSAHNITLCLENGGWPVKSVKYEIRSVNEQTGEIMFDAYVELLRSCKMIKVDFTVTDDGIEINEKTNTFQ